MDINLKPLKIGIEVLPLSDRKLTGVGRVVKHYIEELQKIDGLNEYHLYSIAEIKHASITNPLWIKHQGKTHNVRKQSIFFRIKKNIYKYLFILGFYHFFYLPYRLRKDKIDIFIATSAGFFPFLLKTVFRKKIIFIYDLVWKKFPETMELRNRLLMKFSVLKNIRFSDLIITISEAVKKEVNRELNVTKNITAIPLAADSAIFFPSQEKTIGQIREKYGLIKKYLLTVCTLEPRKNLLAVIDGFAALPDRNSYQLVLAGKEGWGNLELNQHIEMRGISSLVIRTGYIPDEDLAPLYSGAEAYISASLYEGFGLPVLEAMQCACPVIISDIEVHREVAGDAGIYFDLKNPSGLTETLDKFLKSGSRKACSSLSSDRASGFSWKHSAEILYRQIFSDI